MDNISGKLQVLIAAMNENDFSLVEKMNIKCDCIIANQTDNASQGVFETTSNTVTVINSTLKGLGANRNLALDNAKADIVMFADDDMVYSDDMAEGVISAFENNPKADVIIFSCTETNQSGEIVKEYSFSNKRRFFFNSLKYPAYVVAARRKKLKRKNIRFSLMFGAGSSYGFGEESVFLADCFKKGLSVYSSDFNIGTSTKELHWFNGYDDEFFVNKGAIYSCIFGIFAPIVALYYSKKYENISGISSKKIDALMEEGIDDYKKKIKLNNFTAKGL